MRFLHLCRIAAALFLLLSPGLAVGHPFLDVQPFPIPPALAQSGATYTLTLVVFPGDTPIESMQLDFELSSPAAFGTPSAALGDGFSFVYDQVADPTHFSIVGDFTGNPLEAFGAFPVAEVTMVAGLEDETLSMLDSSVIVALLQGVGEEFSPPGEFSNVFTPVIVHVVPEPGMELGLAAGIAALCALARRARRAA